MTPRREALVLVTVVLVGTAARISLTATTPGVAFDLQSYVLVAGWLTDGDPFDVYGQATATSNWRWPYPPALFPALALLPSAAAVTGIEAGDLVRGALALADAAVAVVVHRLLRSRGAGAALAGAALVALGPTLVVVSGSHGQLDVAMWLPALVAMLVWQRRPAGRRALLAGMLVGLAAAIKIVPVIVLLALLPTARDRREALQVTAAALAVPGAMLAPFLITDPSGVLAALGYGGILGYGGLSLLAQPDLAEFWLGDGVIALSPLSQLLQDVNLFSAGVALAAGVALCVAARTPAPRAAAVLVVAVLVTGVNVTIAYTAWALVLLAAAGLLRTAAALQLWLLVPTWMVYGPRPRSGWSDTAVHVVYVPLMVGLLGASAVALAVLARCELRRTRTARSPTGQEVVADG
ncbi:MAG: glycosyltransferase 87 family protein [Actinomycetes bacterium]